MIDLVKLRLLAGDGGNGRVSFRREKYIPKGGPDGGQGGNGGDIIIRASSTFSTLQHLANKDQLQAKAGTMGGSRNSTGPRGEDLVITVPLGTVVWLLDENHASRRRRDRAGLQFRFKRADVRFRKYHLEKEGQPIPELEPDAIPDQEANQGVPFEHIPKEKILELTEDGQEVILAQGGMGGKGSISFKSSTNTTPLEAEYGTRGEQKLVYLELQLLADVGLVGLPNAGKSTLLSRLTKARPKIANYPFTTLEAQLGIVEYRHGDEVQQLVLADIPGLIEGAHEGKGLGYSFLRHLKHCRALVFVLSLEEAEAADISIPAATKAQTLWDQFQLLKHEVEEYDLDFGSKKYILMLNKIDLYKDDEVRQINEYFDQQGYKLGAMSAYVGTGLPVLVQDMMNLKPQANTQ